ncbi:RNA polymerase sigma factor [Planctomyces sp. SH-PL62]|uniref:RNA polymerase sigma factor n=1 Tax=Planctomyces sp. SH-PL62 TaxID=1636152 RepID=UPI00078C3DBA|nr:RNA polymerase sigma factor [Planctomyces sp. SH-PL62]AMV36751.1 ECF RNA polymerase sigma factor SigE [Planctomyces sp. SH-PL62]
MTTPTRTTPADPLGVLLTLGVLGERSDARLLELYRSRSVGSGEAFRVLVERHGPMVLAVCRGLVPDRGEAEDAFQAVFLVLIRRADEIRKADSLGPWLHGVALRVARRARRRSARRSARVRPVDPESLSSHAARDPAPDATAPIHAEIDRLPERYRCPIILCGLEGLSYEQAARALDISEPALRGRLHRGRKRLEARLARRGVAAPGSLALAGPPAGLVETVLAQAAAGSLSSLPGSVSSLAKGAILAMSLSSWKPLALASLAALGLVGSVVLAQQAGTEKAERPANPPAPAPIVKAGDDLPAEQREHIRELLKNRPAPEQVAARGKAARDALRRPRDFEIPDGTPLEDLLKIIKAKTATGDDSGIGIHVDPVGLSKADVTLTSPVQAVGGLTIGAALESGLNGLGLDYHVEYGMVHIDSEDRTARHRIKAVEEKLDELIELMKK